MNNQQRNASAAEYARALQSGRLAIASLRKIGHEVALRPADGQIILSRGPAMRRAAAILTEPGPENVTLALRVAAGYIVSARLVYTGWRTVALDGIKAGLAGLGGAALKVCFANAQGEAAAAAIAPLDESAGEEEGARWRAAMLAWENAAAEASGCGPADWTPEQKALGRTVGLAEDASEPSGLRVVVGGV